MEIMPILPESIIKAAPNKLRFENYDIDITVLSEKAVAISLLDKSSKTQFYEKNLQLTNIGANTLIKAFDKSIREVVPAIRVKKEGDNQVLQLTLRIESPFFKDIEEVIDVPKLRTWTNAEALKSSIEFLIQKVKTINENSDVRSFSSFIGKQLQEKHYNSSQQYETIGSIRLPKGKYLLTLSFFVKATGQWMYLYFGEGESVMTNCGFYLSNTVNYSPHTVRKVHIVKDAESVVKFTTYYSMSYQFCLKNLILTAKPLNN